MLILGKALPGGIVAGIVSKSLGGRRSESGAIGGKSGFEDGSGQAGEGSGPNNPKAA